METDLTAVRAELEDERRARIAAEQSVAVLNAQKVDLSGRLDDARAFIERAEAETERARTEARVAAEQAAQLRGQAGRRPVKRVKAKLT
ncbi:hypothetical protein [Burkholderia ubonensis]|uniref:hypothetical protein n=1 Tax=Burkholderia ubonensis TaxID=101571 RepID=UPI00358FEF7D